MVSEMTPLLALVENFKALVKRAERAQDDWAKQFELRQVAEAEVAELRARVGRLVLACRPPTFESAWAVKEILGYQYGRDALEGVHFGWRIRQEHIDAVLAPGDLDDK